MSVLRKVRLDIAPTYEAEALDDSSKLHHVLRSAIRARGSESKRNVEALRPYWGAEHFRLDVCSPYLDASEEKKNEILKLASKRLLEEAYFIEKSGMSFTAKMALLAESTEERMLYSLFSADETVHLDQVLGHLPGAPSSEPTPPFVRFLSDMIRDGDRPSLVLLIQVVLEGWGITHYHELAENCQNPDVKASLRLILKDEARHHGSGMILSKANTFTPKQKNYVRDTMIEFMKMVQCGPQSLVGVIEEKLGHLSRSQRIRLFEQLGCESSTASKIELLRSLLAQVGAHDLIDYLERAGVLRPLSAQECAEIG